MAQVAVALSADYLLVKAKDILYSLYIEPFIEVLKKLQEYNLIDLDIFNKSPKHIVEDVPLKTHLADGNNSLETSEEDVFYDANDNDQTNVIKDVNIENPSLPDDIKTCSNIECHSLQMKNKEMEGETLLLKELIDQMKKRLINQEDIISLLKSSKSPTQFPFQENSPDQLNHNLILNQSCTSSNKNSDNINTSEAFSIPSTIGNTTSVPDGLKRVNSSRKKVFRDNRFKKRNKQNVCKSKRLQNLGTLQPRNVCAACHHSLELPKIHFLCEHSFHQHCFQSFSDDENECPTCQPENKNLLELLKAREYNKDLHETFHSQLEKAHDGFSVVAEYLSRGVFNRYKIITDDPIQKTLDLSERNNNTKQEARKVQKEFNKYGVGAEARLRQSEVKSNPRAMPVSEGRMRMQEQRLQEQRYSQSLEANMTRYAPRTVVETKTVPQPVAKNPFEDDDDDYDETKNPFNDEDEDDDKNNPFREDFSPY